MSDHYAAMQISPRATQAEIKKRYYDLAKTNHPDKGNVVSVEFVRIQQAWEVLKDVDTRRLYDEQCARVQTLSGVARVAAEIDLDDMEYDNEHAVFSTPCRCGSSYQITEEQMSNNVDLMYCNGCTLQIRVLYEVCNDTE